MDITIYTTPNCVQCRQTKVVFDRNDIKYSTIDLSMDGVAMQMVKDLGYTAAPVVIAGNSHWSGFKMDKITNVINKIKLEEHK